MLTIVSQCSPTLPPSLHLPNLYANTLIPVYPPLPPSLPPSLPLSLPPSLRLSLSPHGCFKRTNGKRAKIARLRVNLYARARVRTASRLDWLLWTLLPVLQESSGCNTNRPQRIPYIRICAQAAIPSNTHCAYHVFAIVTAC